MGKNTNIAWQLMPIQLIAVLAFALAAWLLLPHFIIKSAEEHAISSAQTTAKEFILLRTYYTENVIQKVIESGAEITPHHNHKSLPGSIPLPASVIHDMSELIQDSNIRLKFYSPYPFENRQGRALDTFGQDAWKALTKTPRTPFVLNSEIEGRHIVRVAVADTMVSQVCVDCHNSHALSQKTDWKLGDLRGVLEISSDITAEVEHGLWTGRFLALALVVVFGSITALSFRLMMAQVSDWTQDLAESEKKQRELATTDTLTGVTRRWHFFALSSQEFSRSQRYKSPFSVMMLDLDHFKDVNDTYGHAAGDAVLIAMTQHCAGSLRDSDIFGRIGGEEFAIILPETDTKAAFEIADRLRQEVMGLKLTHEGQDIALTVSIGLATQIDDDPNFQTLLDRADKALYAAKNAGRNRVEIAK